MLVASRLVFVHIPRTGGVFVRRALERHLELDPEAPRFPTHASYNDLPDEFRDRPAFCVVRNPWDWYVSWYHHVLAQGPRFDSLPADAPKRRNWETAFSSGRSTLGEVFTTAAEGGLDDPFSRAAHRHDTDLYSEYVRGVVGKGLEDGDLEVGRFEELVPFLVDFLARRHLLTESLRSRLERSPPLNASAHGPYRDYYDEGLRELVAHKARLLIQRFGYTF